MVASVQYVRVDSLNLMRYSAGSQCRCLEVLGRMRCLRVVNVVTAVERQDGENKIQGN